MKIGIISDIEGNDQQLELVLSNLTDCSSIINLGDAVGDKGDSNRVIELLKQCHITSILGNHDLEVTLGKSVPADKVAAELLSGSKQLYHPVVHLTQENKEFIKSRSLSHTLTYRGCKYGFCHSFYATYKNELYFDYVTADNALLFLEMRNVDVAFIGHKHMAELFLVEENKAIKSAVVKDPVFFTLAKKKRCIINVGSVGAPRNETNMYSYAILDLERRSVQLCFT